MNGAFKFKENLFLKYKKEIMLTVGAVLTLATVVKFIPGDGTRTFSDRTEQLENELLQPVVEEVIQSDGFIVMLDGKEMGVLQTIDEGQEAVERAVELAIDELGYDPEVVLELIYKDNFSLEETYLNNEDLAFQLKDLLINGLDQLKVKGYVMKIGDDFTIAMSCEEDIQEVLKNAQNIYINSEEMALEINLAKDSHNPLVMTPMVTMIRENPSATVSRSFQGDDGSEASIEAGLEEKLEIVEEKDVRVDGETVSVDFAENVMVVESYVYPEEIEDVTTATQLITKENDEPKKYTIVKNDVPSIIAERNNMTTTALYDLNPGLKENSRRIQIGDEVVVLVPEPELSVTTEEEVVYTEPIYKGTTYQSNPDKYEGSESVVDSGNNGIMEVTAIVSKINGKEIDRTETDRRVVSEASDKIISKGTKPLPPKGATGNYIAPLTSYRVTSPFGYRWGGFHYGIDLAASTGTPVMAADGGKVTIAGWYGNYGYLVEINHGNGVRTRYGHNSAINVSVGQQVAQYEVIAKVGSTGRSTGPHTHFEIRFDGVCANPANYINF